MLSFNVVILDINGTPGDYREIRCDSLQTCYVEKCNNGPSTSGDLDCSNLPFDM